MTKRRFFGVIPPTITALNRDESLDRAGMARVVEHQIAGGVDGLFVLGSNGEGPTLRDAVRREVCDVAVEAARGRVPVLAGVLQPSTARTIDDMRLLGGTGILAYNIPHLTKVALKADVIMRLAEDRRIVGLKDSSGDWPQVQQVILERPHPDFVVLQGNQ